MRRTPVKVNRDRDRQAMELRKAGAAYAAIAQQLGYHDKSGARKAVMRVLHETLQVMHEDAAEVRELELARLDDMLLGLWSDARKGKWLAVDRVLKIMERRAALTGIDAPKRQEISGPEGGAIQVEQDVTYSVEERQRRILAIVDAARGRPDLAALPGRSDVDSAGGGADSGMAV